MYFYVAFLSVPDYEDDQRQLEAVFVKAAKVVKRLNSFCRSRVLANTDTKVMTDITRAVFKGPCIWES